MQIDKRALRGAVVADDVLRYSASREQINEHCTSRFIDPRAAHVIDSQEETLLYLPGLGRVETIDRPSGEVLRWMTRAGQNEVQAWLDSQDELGDGLRKLLSMREGGQLTFTPIDREGHAAFQRSLLRHKPRRLQLLMAQMCNLRCVYCYEEKNGSNARGELMPWETAKQAIDYLFHRNGDRKDVQLTFFGGEPLLNFKTIKKAVAYAEDLGEATGKKVIFELITNGSLLSEEVLEYIIEHKFLLMISLDGDAEMNAFNRPSVSGSDHHPRILRNAKRATRRYAEERLGNVKVRANLTHAYHDLIGVVRYLESQGFNNIGVAPIKMLPWEHTNEACTEEDLDEIKAARRELERIAEEKLARGERLSVYEAQITRDKAMFGARAVGARGVFCGIGRNTNIVDVDGAIYPCHRYGNMQQYILGNVFDGLDEDRTGRYYEAVSQASIEKCDHCWARHLCGGPCAWESSAPDGKVHAPRENHCARVRQGAEEAIALYHSANKSHPEIVSPSGGCGC